MKSRQEINSGRFNWFQPTKVSREYPVSASGTFDAIRVGSGDYVWKVGLMAKGVAVTASSTINVGDGGRTDRYLDGISTIATNDIVFQTIETASNSDTDVGTLRTHEVGGHRYTANDTIDIVITNSKSGGGTVQLFAWISNDPENLI